MTLVNTKLPILLSYVSLLGMTLVVTVSKSTFMVLQHLDTTPEAPAVDRDGRVDDIFSFQFGFVLALTFAFRFHLQAGFWSSLVVQMVLTVDRLF
jgi:hypothetical protein